MNKTRLADIPENQMNDYWKNVLWENAAQTVAELQAAIIRRDIKSCDALGAELAAEMNEVRGLNV